jgi:hypothetical protein
VEQAFLKIKLWVVDASEVEKRMKEINNSFENGGKKAANSFKDAMNKGNTFVEWGKKIAKGFVIKELIDVVIKRANENVNTTQGAIREEREGVLDVRSYQRLLGANEIQSQNLVDMLKISGARNPYNLLTNFVNKLASSRLDKDDEEYDPLLRAYKDMNNFDAFMSFLADLTSDKFSSDKYAKILAETFGKYYADNTSKMLSDMMGRGGVMESYNEQVKIKDDVAKKYGFSNGQELLSFGLKNIEESNRRELLNKTRYDFLKLIEISKPETLLADENLNQNKRRAEL